MRLNLFKKLVAVCLCFAIFFGTSINSYATEEGGTVSPRYTYISNYSLSLSTDNGNAHIAATLTSKDSSLDCYIKCNLEKLTGSTYWMQIKSFETTGKAGTALSGDHAIGSGTYRVMGTFRINNEIQTAYTGNKTY